MAIRSMRFWSRNQQCAATLAHSWMTIAFWGVILGGSPVDLLRAASSGACSAQEIEATDPPNLDQLASEESGVDRAKLIEMTRTLIEQLRDEQFEQSREHFSEVMRRALPVATLEQNWRSVISPYGPLIEIETEAEVDSFQTWTAVFVGMRFERGYLKTKAVYNEAGEIDGLFFVVAGEYRSPDYVDVNQFTSEEVSVGKGWFKLPGTLTVPVGEDPFPAVVLIQGSGPNDRDETIGPNKPFRDLAEGLSSQGIIVLRFDKRTLTHSWAAALGSSQLTVKEEVINDCQHAIRLLRDDSRVDAHRIVVIGHSLGGMLLPRIHQAEPELAGFVGLAANARPLEDLILDQVRFLFMLDQQLSDIESTELAKLQAAVDLVKSPTLTPETAAAGLPLGIPATYWLDLRDYRPAEAAQQITRPLLLIQGGRDYQVTSADFELWKSALSDRAKVEFEFLPELNHLLMAGEDSAGHSAGPAEYMKLGNVDARVVERIVQFVKGLE